MDSTSNDNGPRLLSLSALCIWDGPSIGECIPPFASLETPNGIYALKEDAADRAEWRYSEHCWVTGTVALSGRVVEHALGYRAQRVVIRELRLGVGTHLAVRSLKMLGQVRLGWKSATRLPLDAGGAERRIADRMLANGFKPRVSKLPFVYAKAPWRLV